MKFAYFTDLHLPILERPRFGALLNKRILGYQSWLRKRRKRHQLWTLDALVADMHGQDCNAVLLGGDIVNIALPLEFAAAKTWLDSAFKGFPTAMVPGNHDSYVALPWADGLGQLSAYMSGAAGLDSAPQPRANSDDFPYIASLPSSDQICVIGANSSPPTAPALASGSLGPDQCARLKDQLEAANAAGLYTVLMLHHPINDGVVSWRKGLDDAAELRAVIAQAGVDLVLHGHTHFPCLNEIATPSGPAPVFGGASASHAGAHGKYRPARYAVIDISGSPSTGWKTQIDVREIDMQTRCVASVETHVFTRMSSAIAA